MRATFAVCCATVASGAARTAVTPAQERSAIHHVALSNVSGPIGSKVGRA